MTPRPKRTRRDTNQAAIIAELIWRGFYVQDLADVGGQTLDLLCFYRGICLPVEIKRVGYFGDLTQGERDGICYMRLCGVDPIIATRAEDVIAQWPEVPSCDS